MQVLRALADRLDMPALLTDLVAFYRSFVVFDLLPLDTRQRTPTVGSHNCSIDTGMYFGDGHAPFPSSLCMTWPFFILCELFCMRPAKVTTWCVRTQSKTGVPYSGPDPPPVHPTPGTFDHMDAHPDTSGSSSFRAFREVWVTAAEPIQICADELSCESKIYHC